MVNNINGADIDLPDCIGVGAATNVLNRDVPVVSIANWIGYNRQSFKLYFDFAFFAEHMSIDFSRKRSKHVAGVLGLVPEAEYSWLRSAAGVPERKDSMITLYVRGFTALATAQFCESYLGAPVWKGGAATVITVHDIRQPLALPAMKAAIQACQAGTAISLVGDLLDMEAVRALEAICHAGAGVDGSVVINGVNYTPFSQMYDFDCIPNIHIFSSNFYTANIVGAPGGLAYVLPAAAAPPSAAALSVGLNKIASARLEEFHFSAAITLAAQLVTGMVFTDKRAGQAGTHNFMPSIIAFDRLTIPRPVDDSPLFALFASETYTQTFSFEDFVYVASMGYETLVALMYTLGHKYAYAHFVSMKFNNLSGGHFAALAPANGWWRQLFAATRRSIMPCQFDEIAAVAMVKTFGVPIGVGDFGRTFSGTVGMTANGPRGVNSFVVGDNLLMIVASTEVLGTAYMLPWVACVPLAGDRVPFVPIRTSLAGQTRRYSISAYRNLVPNEMSMDEGEAVARMYFVTELATPATQVTIITKTLVADPSQVEWNQAAPPVVVAPVGGGVPVIQRMPNERSLIVRDANGGFVYSRIDITANTSSAYQELMSVKGMPRHASIVWPQASPIDPTDYGPIVMGGSSFLPTGSTAVTQTSVLDSAIAETSKVVDNTRMAYWTSQIMMIEQQRAAVAAKLEQARKKLGVSGSTDEDKMRYQGKERKQVIEEATPQLVAPPPSDVAAMAHKGKDTSAGADADD
uniref:Uncharacterized protein n=1 Tax=viral metagenome TaxID=1070528 RepID=A0A2V0RNE9_9ZZZZ